MRNLLTAFLAVFAMLPGPLVPSARAEKSNWRFYGAGSDRSLQELEAAAHAGRISDADLQRVVDEVCFSLDPSFGGPAGQERAAQAVGLLMRNNASIEKKLLKLYREPRHSSLVRLLAPRVADSPAVAEAILEEFRQSLTGDGRPDPWLPHGVAALLPNPQVLAMIRRTLRDPNRLQVQHRDPLIETLALATAHDDAAQDELVEHFRDPFYGPIAVSGLEKAPHLTPHAKKRLAEALAGGGERLAPRVEALLLHQAKKYAPRVKTQPRGGVYREMHTLPDLPPSLLSDAPELESAMIARTERMRPELRADWARILLGDPALTEGGKQALAKIVKNDKTLKTQFADHPALRSGRQAELELAATLRELRDPKVPESRRAQLLDHFYPIGPRDQAVQEMLAQYFSDGRQIPRGYWIMIERSAHLSPATRDLLTRCFTKDLLHLGHAAEQALLARAAAGPHALSLLQGAPQLERALVNYIKGNILSAPLLGRVLLDDPGFSEKGKRELVAHAEHHSVLEFKSLIATHPAALALREGPSPGVCGRVYQTALKLIRSR